MFDLLEAKVEQYNRPDFIALDPISIPHQYTRPQDIEITAFWASILAWGQRKTIINKCQELFGLMDHAPYDFILHHQENDLKPFLDFKHRTFNATDTLYFIDFLRRHYQRFDSLEDAFLVGMNRESANVESALIGFQEVFTDSPFFPARTRKHIASPQRKSSCKRLNMFLRWMVRKDDRGVDFGIWDRILPAQLVCPCDVHVDRVGRVLGLIQRPVTDWQTALELTESLKELCPEDPVKYDFALFGLGIEGFAS
ncbi:TIGR02757 family protein [Dyadobacter jejuensis]|uniref:TIGR02757 family protein n=1 Tax=Dyadobacter jejuensis TaxID=1082580 RepID=UPI001E366A90|nr:TIGR02757 family protein [Dyadobacter jejuensis]